MSAAGGVSFLHCAPGVISNLRRQPTADTHPEPGFPISPVRSGIDPKRKVVATDSMSRIDVKRTLQVAVVDATTLSPVAALTAVLATCEEDASDGGRDGFQRPGTVRRLFFFRPAPIDGGRGKGCVGSVSGPGSEP